MSIEHPSVIPDSIPESSPISHVRPTETRRAHEESPHPDPEKIWDEQEPLYQRIQIAGGFQPAWEQTMKKRPDAKEAFLSHDRGVCCMDERIAKGTGIRLAGSGILMDRETLLAQLQKSGATEVSSHAGCGAAKLALQQRLRLENPNAPEPTEEEVDDFAKEWSQSVAEELKKRTGKNIGYAHHAFHDRGMEGPSEMHIARAAYYDATGRLDLSKAKDVLPPGFVVSRSAVSGKDAASQIELAFHIASGNHGFGTLITREKPFHAVVIGKTKEEIAQLRTELEPLVRGAEGRVVLDEMVVPVE